MLKQRFYLPFALLLLVLLVIALLTRSFFESLKNSIYQERRWHLTETTTQSARITAQTMVDSEELLKVFCGVIEEKLSSELDVTATLGSIQGLHPDESIQLFLVDDHGRYYCGDGKVGKLSDSDLLRVAENGPENDVFIRKMPFSNQDDDGMFFIRRLNHSIPSSFQGNPVRLTHLILLRPMNFMLSRFSTGFERASNSFILDRTGLMLYKQYSLGVLIQGSNYFTKLREACDFFHGESVETIIADVLNGKTCCYEAQYANDNSRAFACMGQIGNSPWYLAYTIPSENLDTGTSSHITGILWYLIGIVTLLGMSTVAVVVYVQKLSSERELLKKKETANQFLEQAAHAAQEASSAKTEFLSHMSHDIRTPINGIMGMTDIAQKNLQDTARVSSCLAKINTSSHHLLSLINDVLDLSRIESGKVSISQASMNLLQVCDNCATIIRGQIGERNLQLVTEFDGFPHPQVLGDELHLRQILINILGNAVKFTPDGGRICFKMQEISFAKKTSKVQFIVEDNGIGMKPEFVKRIFEAFSQEDDGARSKYKGTGLGMSITRKYVILMHGEIHVQSALGKGSTFTVTLPFPVELNSQADSDARDKDQVSLEGAHALLVEDNELNMEVAQELLGDEGIRVSTAKNGLEGLEAFTNNPPGTFDFILMDVMMPIMDGLESTRCIRRLKRADAQTIPIIAMTANAFAEDVQRTKEAGMNAHLSKPIEMDNVLSVLRRFYHADKEKRETT